MNGRTFSPNSRKRGKSHHQLTNRQTSPKCFSQSILERGWQFNYFFLPTLQHSCGAVDNIKNALLFFLPAHEKLSANSSRLQTLLVQEVGLSLTSRRDQSENQNRGFSFIMPR